MCSSDLETPDDFVLAVKGSRFITHLKRLRDVEDGLARFFGAGPLALEEHGLAFAAGVAGSVALGFAVAAFVGARGQHVRRT